MEKKTENPLVFVDKNISVTLKARTDQGTGTVSPYFKHHCIYSVPRGFVKCF